MYAKLVDKVGTRTYWEDWADDVAGIAQAQITRIKALLAQASPQLKSEFDAFVDGLRGNLNDSISEDEAISMLSQHLITAPVFNALFTDYDFAQHNAVSKVMQRMVDALADHNLESETDVLERFYDSVRVRASQVTSAEGKQQVIKELYERFFKKAFKKQSESLGIVYTPVEIVDFILRAADDASKKHFGKGLSDEEVCILDPFAGTSTFTARLLQSGLIKPEDLARKYAGEIFATEIMLLAYYVSTVNIETTYNALAAANAAEKGLPEPEYVPFRNIALADTFQIHEEGDIPDLKVFADNNATIERQKAAPINVVVGNPPYSAGQTSANDLNANLKYPSLDKRIADTYAEKSTATNKNSLYDSYLRAFRWATDRIGHQGIVAFVSNNGWLDGNTGDGVRLSLQEDFTDVYVLNLRGNSRTAGELAKKEGGNVFDIRVGVSILIGVKDPRSTGFSLHYACTDDYMKREDKLRFVTESTIHNIDWQTIEPNEHGDWLNQRSADFGTWPVLSEKKGASVQFFNVFSAGLQTNRDAWVVSNSSDRLCASVKTLGEAYNIARDSFVQNPPKISRDSKQPGEAIVNSWLKLHPEHVDPTKIKWSRSLRNSAFKQETFAFSSSKIYQSLYRPFTRQLVYFDKLLNHERYQLPSMFPTPQHTNIGFEVMAPRNAADFAVLAVNMLPDLSFFTYTAQFFPRFTWKEVDESYDEFVSRDSLTKSDSSKYGEVGEVIDGYRRVDNITEDIRKLYRDALGADITGDDIFHFVYGKLHDPVYREKYAADLKKMLPHIETPETREEFERFASAGAKLMDLHVNYEDAEPWPVTIDVKPTVDANDRETWRAIKPKWAKKKDPETGKSVNDVTTMIYNNSVTIRDIPVEADEYMLGSRSALAWIIDRYQVKKDKASGIVNDPNDWADEVGNPRYIVVLVAKVTRVAVETVRIVEALKG